jgi:hypothetical protein
MCGFYIPSASGRGDIAKLFLQEECARRQKTSKEDCGNEKTPAVGKERGGKGMGW